MGAFLLIESEKSRRAARTPPYAFKLTGTYDLNSRLWLAERRRYGGLLNTATH